MGVIMKMQGQEAYSPGVSALSPLKKKTASKGKRYSRTWTTSPLVKQAAGAGSIPSAHTPQRGPQAAQKQPEQQISLHEQSQQQQPPMPLATHSLSSISQRPLTMPFVLPPLIPAPGAAAAARPFMPVGDSKGLIERLRQLRQEADKQLTGQEPPEGSEGRIGAGAGHEQASGAGTAVEASGPQVGRLNSRTSAGTGVSNREQLTDRVPLEVTQGPTGVGACHAEREAGLQGQGSISTSRSEGVMQRLAQAEMAPPVHVITGCVCLTHEQGGTVDQLTECVSGLEVRGWMGGGGGAGGLALKLERLRQLQQEGEAMLVAAGH